MIILIEGLNCTGKSTLAENLRSHLEIPVLKFDVPGDDVYGEFRSRLQWGIDHNTHFIIDRLHLSNIAYNGELGGSVLVGNEWNMIDQMVANQKALLYWMVDSPQAIKKRIALRQGRSDGAEKLDRNKIAAMHNRFAEAFQRSQIPNKGSFTLPQFVEDGQPTEQFYQNLKVIKAVMAGVAF